MCAQNGQWKFWQTKMAHSHFGLKAHAKYFAIGDNASDYTLHDTAIGLFEWFASQNVNPVERNVELSYSLK